MWVLFAFGSALFAGITAVLSKIGMQDMDSDVGTAVRTGVVLVFSWMMVFLTGSIGTVGEISGRTFLFLVLSGLATGGSWLCYYRALQDGQASVVVPIDKLSILVTILFSRLFLGERLGRRAFWGLALLVAGTLLLLR
jgi:transporter family protein